MILCDTRACDEPATGYWHDAGPFGAGTFYGCQTHAPEDATPIARGDLLNNKNYLLLVLMGYTEEDGAVHVTQRDGRVGWIVGLLGDSVQVTPETDDNGGMGDMERWPYSDIVSVTVEVA